MYIKKYKVIEKRDGKVNSQLFESIKDAVKVVGAANIQKLEEVNYEEEVSESSLDKKLMVVVARKSNDELTISEKSGYTATVSRPMLTKVFNGMTILEVGEDKILESSLSMIGRYDKNAHKVWNSDAREWEWIMYHKKGKTLSLVEAKTKYGDLERLVGRDGAISYVSKLKM